MKKKKTIYIVFTIMAIVFVMLFTSAVPSLAHGGGSVRVWIGPGWWGPWWWGPAAYPYPYYGYPYYGYYAQQPVVIQQQPPVYDQQTQQPVQQYYWYFCPDSKTYYPYVKQCLSDWLKVIPPSAPPQ
jgi:hypothetical protein